MHLSCQKDAGKPSPAMWCRRVGLWSPSAGQIIFQVFRSGRLDMALIVADVMLIQGSITVVLDYFKVFSNLNDFIFYDLLSSAACLLAKCKFQMFYEIPPWHQYQTSDSMWQRRGKDAHKCQHHITKSEVSTAKQSQAPAENLLKPTKLNSHDTAIKTALRPHRR